MTEVKLRLFKKKNCRQLQAAMTIAQLDGLEEQLRRRPDDASIQLKIGGSPPRSLLCVVSVVRHCAYSVAIKSGLVHL